MDDSKNQTGNARLLNMPGRRDQMLRTMLLCALTAAIFFLPFYIIDGGFFHYAGDFNSQQISFYRYMNGFIKGAGYPDGMAGAASSTFSWATDLGSGAMNAYSFYLYGSPFFWLSLIFPQNWLPYLMVPLLVLKFAVAGGGAYRYLCRYVRRSDHAVLGACCMPSRVSASTMSSSTTLSTWWPSFRGCSGRWTKRSTSRKSTTASSRSGWASTCSTTTSSSSDRSSSSSSTSSAS